MKHLLCAIIFLVFSSCVITQPKSDEIAAEFIKTIMIKQ